VFEEPRICGDNIKMDVREAVPENGKQIDWIRMIPSVEVWY
jgi:hypothetical protein